VVFGVSLIPAGVEDAWRFVLLGSVSAMLFSMAKSGFGGSVGLLGVAVMIYACGGSDRSVDLATGIMLPMLIAADYVAVIGWWRKWNTRAVGLLLGGAVLGVGLGWLAILAARSLDVDEKHNLANALMMACVGLIAIGFVVLEIVRARRGRPIPFRPVLWQGTAMGAVAGVTSTFAHAAGPVAAMYMLPQRMHKSRYVASMAVFFWIVNQAKLVPYYFLDRIRWDTLGATVLLLPAIAAGAALGIFLHRRVGARRFNAIIYGLLLLAGADLTARGVRAVIAAW